MRKYALAAVVLSLFVLAGRITAAIQPLSVRELYRTLSAEARKAYKAKDYASALKAFQQLYYFAPGRPSTVYNLACVHARLGHIDEARRWLRVFADMGQVADVAADEDLAPLAKSPEFLRLASAKTAAPAKDASETTATITGAALIEDLAYDARIKDFYLTGLLDKKVLRLSGDKKLTVVADLSSDPGWPVFAIALENSNPPVLWVTAAAMPDFAVSPKKDAGKSLLLKLDARTGKILARIAPPDDSHPHVLADLAISSDGSLVLSDGIGGAVYLVKPNAPAMDRIDVDEFISPQTPAFSADGNTVFVPDYLRGIARIDLKSGSVSWLQSAEQVATSGIDGLYLHNGHFIAVQNGTTPPRIVSFRLNPSMTRIEAADVIASRTDATADINHAAIVGNDIYFISHAGWDALDDNGKRKPDAKPSTPEVRSIPLAKAAR